KTSAARNAEMIPGEGRNVMRLSSAVGSNRSRAIHTRAAKSRLGTMVGSARNNAKAIGIATKPRTAKLRSSIRVEAKNGASRNGASTIKSRNSGLFGADRG